jgi:hypothetical protein
MVFHRVHYTGPVDRPLPAGSSLCSLHRWFTAPDRLVIHCVHHTGWSFSVRCTEPAGRSLYSLHRTVFITPDGRSLCALQWTCWSFITRWSFIVFAAPNRLVFHCAHYTGPASRSLCSLLVVHYLRCNRSLYSLRTTKPDPLVMHYLLVVHCAHDIGPAGRRRPLCSLYRIRWWKMTVFPAITATRFAG